MFKKRGKPNYKRPFKPRTYQNKSKEYRHHDQLTESEVGITEFISKLDGFSGIIKARFSDFHVNEISLDGVVAKLTNNSVPKDFRMKAEQVDLELATESPTKLIPQDVWSSVRDLVLNKNAVRKDVELEADSLSKEERKTIHETIKSVFGAKVVASTVAKEDKKFLVFKKFDKDDKNDNRFQWPQDKPEYVHFLVYKEAIDTLDAALKISDCLRMATSNFAYAGVKDKRAKTTQWFSVRKVEPWKLIIKTRPLRNIHIGNITFKDAPIKLGQLSGNKFRIALRNVTVADEFINEALSGLKANGFINYYGLQRFGNDKEVPTFAIGLNLLLGAWKEAVQLILKPKTSDDPDWDVSKAKKNYAETEDAAKALKEIEESKNTCVESKLLAGLAKGHANDYVNALESIPRNSRLLYLHSFQSLVWNKVVSKRIELFGLNPVVGDLILVKDEVVIPDENAEEEEIKCKQEVKALTEANLSEYNIYDIVLPLPGYDIIYPENMKEFYKEILEEQGLSLEMEKQKVQTYTLSGTYRKMMSQVKDLSWKVMQYNDPIDPLIRSDFEELKCVPKPKGGGQYKALIMEFSLNSSSYATMVLREILKSNTASSAQAKLNNYHELNQDKKIIIDQNGASADNKYTEIMQQSNSLLKDQDKYNEFKNSIFNAVAESTTKHKGDDSTSEDGPSKKLKLDEN